MLEWLDTLCVKWLFSRDRFTKVDKNCGRYWSDNFEVKNNSDKDHFILVLDEQR